MEGSLVAYKVFTNGSVLPASDVNTYLMNQSVMVFSNSTTRAAALTAPVEGMLTWLEDVNRYEYRNGSGAWVALASPSGLTRLATQTFTSATAVNIDNVFSATYNAYKVILSSTVSAGINPGARFRVGGVASTTNYNQQYMQASGTSVSGGRDLAFNRFNISGAAAAGFFQDWTIHGVALAQRTYGTVNAVVAGTTVAVVGLEHTTATAYDGLGLIFDTATTGEVRIYGLENS
jgi:hypothetical protein